MTTKLLEQSMARPQSIEDKELLARLACVFRDAGYEGASLAMLSQAANLKKASLYHRFPGGKQQMAGEVLAAALDGFGTGIIAALQGEGSPAERLSIAAKRLDAYYESGLRACLLNMLAVPHDADGPFAATIKSAFEATNEAFAGLAREAGHDRRQARARAERAVMLLHGSLVLSRGLGSSKPFQAFLKALPGELLGQETK